MDPDMNRAPAGPGDGDEDMHRPTSDTRSMVSTMVAIGIPQATIAKVVGIAEKTLRKHYREEIDVALPRVNARVAQSLYRKATSDTHPQSVTAAIFWLKTRAGFKEVSAFEIYGKDGGAIETREEAAFDFGAFSDEEMILWQTLMAKARPAPKGGPRDEPAPDDD